MATPTTTGNAQDIIALEHAFWRALRARDVEAAQQLIDDTSIVAGPQGYDSIDRKAFARMMTDDRWTLNGYEFLGEPAVQFARPDVAVIAYKVREEMTVEGKPLTLEAAESSTWIRREGSWRCFQHTESILGDPFGRDRVSQPPTNESLAQQDAVANLAVKDLKAARKFYENTLGFTPVHEEGGELVVYKSGHSTLNVYHSEFAGTNQATAVTWQVSDLGDTVKDLKAKGVAFEHYDMLDMKLEGDIHVADGMKVAWFKDPDGNILNLISH